MAATARWLLLLLAVSAAAASGTHGHGRWRMGGGQVVEKERRRVVAWSEAGSVTAVDVADAAGSAYRLHFIDMDPGALFLPVQLHADVVFYVHSGRGKVTFIEEESGEQSSLEVERGDVYNLEQGSILYIQSYPNATRQRLRIYAMSTGEGIHADDPSDPKVEAYSRVSNLVKGFETQVLRLAFGVQAEVVEAIKSTKTPPQIIAYNPEKKGDEKSNWTEDIVDALLGVRDPEEFLNKKKKDKKHKSKDKKSKSKVFNFYSGKPDVHNCYGWSRTMTNKDLDALHGSSIGMFMVNLTTGSMMGPHWNPRATEIAIVTDGSGIVQTVCPSTSSDPSPGGPGGRGDEHEGGGARCRNSVFSVKEGDVFVVPRFHPMAQMSFNNGSFVFVGFSTHMGQNHPQFLAGEGSVLQAIGKEVLALALGQPNSIAVGKLLSAQRGSTILACISCAEELEKKAAEDRKSREEEERKEREEKERREREKERKEREREEKERKEREREEKERKEREEEQRREREEKERKEREEKQRKEWEEEERREREEERKEREEEERREEEDERARREQEEQQRREEEEWARREEEQRKREEEERRREEEEGGGGGDVPAYRLSKKLKKRYRAGIIRRG